MNTTLPFRTALGTLLIIITLLFGMIVGPTGAAAAQPFHATTSGAGLRPTAQRWHAARNLSLSQLPANLSSVVRRTLAAQAARDYFLFHDGQRYLAANPSQHLQTVFTADGAHVSTAGAAYGWGWGLHLEGMGRNTIDHVPTAGMVARGRSCCSMGVPRNGTGMDRGGSSRDSPYPRDRMVRAAGRFGCRCA